MTFFEIFTLLASSATIFGFIVGVFSIYNGRMTRREISRLTTSETGEMRKLMESESKASREILAKLSEQHEAMIKMLAVVGSR